MEEEKLKEMNRLSKEIADAEMREVMAESNFDEELAWKWNQRVVVLRNELRSLEKG